MYHPSSKYLLIYQIKSKKKQNKFANVMISLYLCALKKDYYNFAN